MRKKIFTFLLALAASVGLMNAAVDGKLPGAFTVDESGTQVYFSKGNLQYQASTNTWRFAENQYEAVGGSNGEGCAAPYNNTSSANQSPSDSQTGWIDLFGWAASGISRTGVTAYQPYSTSETDTDYGTTFTKSASETLGNYDWGKNMGDDWRTLTAEEWGYLIGPGNGGTNPSGQRANYQSLRGLCYITVGSTSYPGMIILPDDLYNNLPTATEGDIANKWAACAVAAGNSLQYTNATFTEKEWTALQDAGAVFLPAAGFRNGTAVHRAGANGNYWSSSASSSTNAFYLYFRAGYLDPEYSNYRNSGRSVRLVSETAPGGSTPANSCGDGLTWELNAGVFTISYDGVGTGVMDDFDYNEHPAPWQSSKESITSVIIPDGVTRIGNNAFSGANNLASVSMGDDVVAIGNNAFEACSSLSSITLSSHVTTIGDYAFAGLQSLTSIVLPSTVQSIGTSAFYDNQGLTSITCEGTTPPTLGQYVFGMIGNGATLYVPYGYAETYQGADSQWQALNIQVIGSGSASYPYCGDGLTWTYNDGVLTIIYDGVGTGDMLDYGNYNIYPWDSYKDDITSVIIPDGVIRIGNYAFANLTNLASVSMGDDVVEIGYGGFWNCLSLQSITLGSHVTTIGEHAFGSNHALTSITLPNTLQTIGGSAFYNCNSLPTITIPSSVTSFGEYAFGFCEGLTSFTCEGTTPPTLGQDVFTMVPYHRPLYVPNGYVETYQGADSQWQIFDISIIPAPAVDPAVQNVIDLINAIPNPVVYNQECFDALNAAHNAYVALSEEQRDQVTNYNDYVAAEETYWNLKAANDVITLINAIGDVEYTPECKAKIDAARSAYNNLNLEKKGYVSNYNTLLDAEAAYAALIPVSSTVVWDEAVLATINVENGTLNETFTKDGITLTALNGSAYYPDEDDHFLLDGMNDESFSFSSTSADIVRIEITVSEKMDDTELIDGWQETATGYRWIGEASSVDFGITLPKVTQIAFYLGNGSTPEPTSHPHGQCGAQGDNLLWDLDPNTGVLTITGSGAMNDWPDDTNLPWYDNRLQITSVVLPSGITSIGTKAFRGCSNLASINMTENYPAGLTAINQEAFCNTKLTLVTIPESVVTIGQDAFYLSQAITDVYCYADPNNLTWNDFWCDDFNKTPAKSTQCHVKDCYLAVYNSKWNSGSQSTDVNVTFAGDLPGDCGAPTPTPTGDKLPGAFTVDNTGKQVNFSKGNVQYVGGSWKFADNQWDMIGNAQADNNRDLFGWGTGSEPNKTIEDESYYTTFTDWGTNFGEGWRTLTKDEWIYLLETRDNAANLRTLATVNSVKGLILMPDGWTASGVALAVTLVNYTSNMINDESKWATLANQGCVFLPAAGYRSGNEVSGVGVEGYYFSSTNYSDNHAAHMAFEPHSVTADQYTFAYCGNSVRLVTDAGGSTPTPSIPTVGMKGSWDNWDAVVNFTNNGNGTASAAKSFDHEGYYTFKTVLDGDDWRGNGYTYKRTYTGAEGITENGDNMTFWVDAKGEYTFTWTYATNAINITYPTLPTIQTKGSWDNWTDALNFTDNGDGTASVTKHFDAEGYHDFKINVGADDWRGNGETFKRDYTGAQWINDNGSDMKLYVDEPGDYTFTWSYVENALSIALPAQSAREVETNGDPQDPTYYYSTFYHSANKYALPDDVEAFVADLSGSDLVLTKIAVTGQTIPSNTAVILRRANSPEKIQLIPSNAEAVTFTAHNSLQGVDMATAAPANCYVLSGTAQYGVGFYRILGSELKAHKAYVIYNGSAAPKRMRFVFNQEQTATGVENVQPSDIRSQKVLENGILYIIKNGVRYNAQGQIVK